MKLKKLRGMASLLLAGALLFTSVPASQMPTVVKAAEKWEEVNNATLRDYATPSVPFDHSEWGQTAESFADESMDSFWNGYADPDIETRDQWIMYDFGSRQAEITGMSICFEDDGGGVIVPTDITVEYATGGEYWQQVNRKGNWTITEEEKTYEFDPVTVSKIRVTMTHGTIDGQKIGVAVRDWKLLGEIPADFPKPNPDLSLPDVAVYAVPSAHENHTSPWENLNGINNENFNPTVSDGGNGKGWGNWGQGHAANTVCWLQYDWDEAVTTRTFQVFWYGSEAGMKIPSNVRFQYTDANGAWKDVGIKSDKGSYSNYDRYNQIILEEPITTKAIRMYMTVAGDSLGVYRWKVYSNISDEFVVAAAGNSLVIPEVKEGAVSSRIYEKLTLPTKAMNDRVNVSWKSKNTDVISDDGVITPPSVDTKVILTATCSMADNPGVKKDKDIEIKVLSDKTTEYAMTIDQTKKGVDISQELYGVFYEDINSAADGGLSAELVKNNSFENYQNLHAAASPEVKGDQNSWKLHWDSSNAANFVVERTDGLNANNKNYAKITGNQTLSNHGFVSRASLDKSAMGIRKDVEYDFSMYMKAGSSYAGNVKVKVVDDAGTALTNEAALTLKKDGEWQKISASLTANTTKLGTLVLTFEGAGASDAMYIDMVSLIPTDGYGYGNKNYSYGAGLRKDLVEKLQQLNPGFIRFPGGCVVEGSYGTDGYYNWEDSVGPLEERRAIGSYWGSPGKSVYYYMGQDQYGYMMSYQFGYHEVLTLCEDLGAQAFPILNAGIFCQFTDTAFESFEGEQLQPFADHATHLIDYCWGDPDSADEIQAYWAKKRVANGHAEPFDLNYLGIGNENWDDERQGVSYQDNFKWIKNKVESYVEQHYTDRKITIISSTGPYYQGSQGTKEWSWINRDIPGETLVDEHYYINYAADSDNTLLNGDYIYDNYKRLNEGGSDVFVGEYAGHLTSTKENVLDTAISEAAYMTGIERNGDIVRHASYAPLFEREGCRDWDYNLIKFNAFESYGTPSYYVQTMYSNNYGKYIINTTLQKYNSETSSYEEKPGHQTDLYYVTSEDDDYIYTKLVNHADYAKEITLSYPGLTKNTEVQLICISGDSMDMNTIEDQEKVVPVTTEATISGGKLVYEVPAMSLTIVKVNYTGTQSASKQSVQRLSATMSAVQNQYQQSDYTPDSWTAFTAARTAALAKAQEVADNATATQEQVDVAQAALDEAIGKLVGISAEPEFVQELNSFVAAAEGQYQKAAYYTRASWKEYSEALEAAKKAVESGTKKQIETAKAALETAIANLVEVPAGSTSVRELNEILSTAEEQYKETGYTADSWKAYAAALAEAKKASEDKNISQKKMDEVRKALDEAIANLTKQSVSKTALNASIETAKAKKQEDYTPASWSKLTTALTAAENVAKDPDATEAQVKSAQDNLDAALKALVKAETKPQVKVTKKNLTLGVKETYSVKSTGCTYTTSDKKTATVSKSGQVKAVKTGKVTVKAIDKNGNITQYTVTVKKAPDKKAKVKLNKKKVTLSVKNKKKKTFIIKPKLTSKSYGCATFKYTIDKKGKKIVKVDKNGKVTARKKGKATITVKTYNGKGKKATLKVTVK